MLKQRINGKNVATLYVEGSQADIDALKALLEGSIEEYELKASGGTSAPLPSVLDTRRYAVGKRGDGISCSFRIHHLKDGKNHNDVINAVVGAFDAHYELTLSCDYCNPLYDVNKS